MLFPAVDRWKGNLARRGFLLLELTLAMLLISIALVGLLDAHRFALASRVTNNRQAQLRFLLERQIVEIGKTGPFAAGKTEGTFEPQFQAVWSATSIQTPIPDLFRVEVTVSASGESLTELIFVRTPADEEK